MKTCNCCGKQKELNSFSPDKRNKDGLQGISNDCRRINRKGKHKYYRTEKVLAYQNKNQKKHIEALSDFHVIKELRRGTNLTTADIKKHPELIETKRQILINKRKIKDEKCKRIKGESYLQVQRVRKIGRPKHGRTFNFYRMCFGNTPISQSGIRLQKAH